MRYSRLSTNFWIMAALKNTLEVEFPPIRLWGVTQTISFARAQRRFNISTQAKR